MNDIDGLQYGLLLTLSSSSWALQLLVLVGLGGLGLLLAVGIRPLYRRGPT